MDVLYKQCQSELTAGISKRKDGAVFYHYLGQNQCLEASKLPEDCGRPRNQNGLFRHLHQTICFGRPKDEERLSMCSLRVRKHLFMV